VVVLTVADAPFPAVAEFPVLVEVEVESEQVMEV